jgi:hypothetical protein
MTAPRSPKSEWTTDTPITYCIDYSKDHVGNREYLGKVSSAPPDLLHVGHDVPFKSMYGPAAEYDCLGHRLLTRDEVRERIQTLKSYVLELHGGGVNLVIPYICSMFLFGNHDERTGFWEFYDRWDDYAEFGFGSRPEEDPIEWNWQDPRPLTIGDAQNEFVYEPCINRPGWRRFLRVVVGQIARVGYEGVFSDVNATLCKEGCCRELFANYLRDRYSEEELVELLGFKTFDDVRLGERGEGLLWVETVRFRGERMASLFAELKEEGEKHRKGFFVLPNLSPYQTVDGVWRRVGISHVFDKWAPVCPIIMFEEMQQPGLFVPGVVSSFTFQYKYAFANAARAGCLLYNAQDEGGVELAIAEAGAGGGGAFIQGGYACPEMRKEYRRFFAENKGVFRGYRPRSPVGLIFSYDEVAWGTKSHMEQTYRIADELMARHVLYDLVVDADLHRGKGLREHDVVVAAGLEHVSEPARQHLLDYVEDGGILVTAGDFNLGPLNDGGALETTLGGKGVSSTGFGRGKWLVVRDLSTVLPPATFELFMLSEDECNDIDVILSTARDSSPGRPPRELVKLLEDAAGPLSIADCEDTLRFNGYCRQHEREETIVLHALNYNLPIRGRGTSGPPVPSKRTRIRMPVGPEYQIREADLFMPPSGEPVSLSPQLDGSSLEFEIPEVEVYTVIRVKGSSAESTGS